jgi:hypothetical protein
VRCVNPVTHLDQAVPFGRDWCTLCADEGEKTT